MTCSQCANLNRAFDSARTSYIAALASTFFKVSTEVAAKTLVDMERAKLDFIEHDLTCPDGRSARMTATPARAKAQAA